jgi:aminocarboxymuconate-semialdehyde decarboxylase
MDRVGIDVQVLSSWIDMTAYALDGGKGAAYSRAVNEILAEEAGAHPGRFLAMATVPLQQPGASAEELGYAVKELGMIGVEIATTVEGVDLDQAGLDPFWEAADDLGCLVLIHPYQPLGGVDLSRHFLDNLVGRPAESTVAIANLMLSGVFDRYPDLQVCLVHGGGFLPFQLGRLERGYRAVPHRVAIDSKLSPHEVASLLYYDTVLHWPRAISALVGLVGPTRVVLGSDYPFEMGDPDPLATLRATPGLTEDEIRMITSGNLRQLIEGVRR